MTGAAAIPSDAVRRVVVLGGGTAGWITAGVLAARFPARGPDGLEITVVESSERPIIGVGEGTWPTMRGTLKQIGVSETAFLKACDATLKQGSRFDGWVDGAEDDAYLHPFTLPMLDEEEVLALVAGGLDPRAFARAVCFQAALCETGRAPKAITTAEYAGAANYAYHLDAGKFAAFLREHCVEALGVRHLDREVVRVEQSGNGDIDRLIFRDGDALAGDLFVDCSGFSALLIGERLGSPFRSHRDALFVDRAWAVQAAYPSEEAPIATTTVSTARPNGWIWDVGLTGRKGVGHVYASAYTSDDDALTELQGYLEASGWDPASLSYRQIRIEPGHRERFWCGNCVAVGLSAGFLEPLEASAIALVELSAKAIADSFPRRRAEMARAARLFNEAFSQNWRRIIDFLKLHYVLSRRTDSRFWIDNRDPATMSPELRESLDVWTGRAPGRADFPRREEVFPAESYQYVLYGMGFRPEPAPWLGDERKIASAREKLADCRRASEQLLQAMPLHRDLISRIHRYGLKKV